MWIHRLITNHGDGTGICAKCGPVNLILKGTAMRCGIAVKAQGWASASPRIRSKEYRMQSYLKWYRGSHGLTAGEALELKKGRVCEICGEPRQKSLAIDHCHSSMKLRGVLCRKCNTGIGLFRENQELLKNAIAYLSRHNDNAPLVTGLRVGGVVASLTHAGEAYRMTRHYPDMV